MRHTIVRGLFGSCPLSFSAAPAPCRLSSRLLTQQLTSRSTHNLASKFVSKATMSSVSVKNHTDDDRLHIHLQLTQPSSSPTAGSVSSSNQSSMKFTLSRLKNEELKLAIDRLRLNLNKKQSKKSKKKKSKPRSEPEASVGDELGNNDSQIDEHIAIEILHNGEALDASVQNESAWVEGALLKVGDLKIPISYNLPCASLENLPTTILEDCPLFPVVQTEFTTQDQCQFFWKTFDIKELDKVKMQISRENIDIEGAIESESFTPQPDDIGKHVLLVCIPKRGDKCGDIKAVVSQSVVTKGPGHCPFETRHEQTKERAENGCFRVLTYNLLAETYSDTDFARERLFEYCPPSALDMNYRKHLLLKEIVGYKADLLCLQEVDKHIFNFHLKPALSALGYTGLFKPKAGQCSEGCASFIHQDKFKVVNSQDIVLSEYLSSDPACSDIWEEVCKVEPLKERVVNRSSVLQVTVIESTEDPNQLVCLCNTHLYFHPTACNVRLILAATALRHIQAVCEAHALEGKTTAMAFCGDFNSDPCVGVYQLMTSQIVPSDHGDWMSGGKEEALTTLELLQPKNIISATGTPAYTNFTRGFQDTLDYVYIDSDLLEVTKVVPLPSDEEVKANVAMPSVVFPSDHLALVCDLKFR